jgi:hypothetical protein
VRVAVLLHELGHHAMGHVAKRGRLLGCGFVLTGLVLLALGVASALAACVAYGAIVGSLLPWMTRPLELEADRFAVERGATPDEMIRGLERLHVAEGIVLTTRDGETNRTHPSFALRARALVGTDEIEATSRSRRVADFVQRGLTVLLVVLVCATIVGVEDPFAKTSLVHVVLLAVLVVAPMAIRSFLRVGSTPSNAA